MIANSHTDSELAIFAKEFPQQITSNDIELICSTAKALAESGKCLSDWGGKAADVPSTGGPGSLSTLLCPLFLVKAGFKVPKLGIPGRPAGGIDTLAQIAGYAVHLSETEIRSTVSSVNYAHFLSDGFFAPLDARLFQIRQRVGRQNAPGLVVASILSKKLAMGIDFASVDIRAFPGGNFGDSLSEAQDNAWIFTETGKQLGIEVCTHISDGTQISQPYIGRSEALLALYEIFSGTENAWLREHYDTCKSISQRLATERLTNKDIASVFFDNVMHQGGSYESFESISETTKTQHTNHISAQIDGVINFDIATIRDVIVHENILNINEGKPLFGDKVGLILYVKTGNIVESGQTIASFRCCDKQRTEAVRQRISAAVSISP